MSALASDLAPFSKNLIEEFTMGRSSLAPLAIAFALCSIFAAAQVPNDNCATATVIGSPSVTAGTTIGATPEVGVPAGCSGPAAPGLAQNFTYPSSVWYKITSPINGTITADVAGAIDPKIFIFTGTCAGLSCVTANDNISASGACKAAWAATLGVDYFLMIGAAGANGAFTLTVSHAPRPLNDDCSLPTVLSPLEAGSAGGTTVGCTSPSYTSTTAYPSCAGTGGIFDVWYQYRACATGNLTLSTCGAYDTTLSVHTTCPGTAGPNNQIAGACNDDGAGGCAPGSQLTVAVTSGTAYFIRVAGKTGSAAGGPFVLTWSATNIPTWFQDADGDGYGNAAVSATACAPPIGYVANSLDCNDSNAAISPSAAEICDGIDNDCDNLIDNADPSVVGQATWYQDSDGDGFGNPAAPLLSCTQPPGYVANNADCNDGNMAVHPGATEICNGIDDDCDNLIDSADPGVVGQSTWYQDADGDGFGNPAVSQLACTQPPGYVANNADCNDGNMAVHPGAPEICNGIDDDCDNATDEVCPSNDLCINAIPIGNGQVTGNNAIAASEIASLACGAVEHDVWWSYTNTGPCAKTVVASLCPAEGGGASFDAVMHVFSGTCGNLTLVGCNDNTCGTSPRVAFPMLLGETRLIAVSSHAGSPGGGITMNVFEHTAGLTTLGPGCSPFGGAGATLTLDAPPTLSSTRTITVSAAAPNSITLLMFSGDGGGVPSGTLSGGCPFFLSSGSTVLWQFVLTDATGFAQIMETVPGNPAFNCFVVVLQGIVFPSGGAPSYQLTNALGLVIGN